MKCPKCGKEGAYLASKTPLVKTGKNGQRYSYLAYKHYRGRASMVTMRKLKRILDAVPMGYGQLSDVMKNWILEAAQRSAGARVKWCYVSGGLPEQSLTGAKFRC